VAQFGDPLFGEEEFSMTLWQVALSDSITPTDTIAKKVFITLQDTQNTVDSISDGVSLTAFMDNIRLGNAGIGVLFGNWEFGETTFMQTDLGGNLLLMPIKVLSDSITLSDFLAPFSVSKALSDTITLASTISFDQSIILADVLFLSEVIHVEITNKALMDTIRLNDWLQMKLNASEPWGDN
jgi:hypothetical protein